MSDSLERTFARHVDTPLAARPPAPAAPPPVAYSLKAASTAVGVSEGHLRRQIHTGCLRARMVGRKYYIGHDDLKAWFEGLPEANTYMSANSQRYAYGPIDPPAAPPLADAVRRRPTRRRGAIHGPAQ